MGHAGRVGRSRNRPEPDPVQICCKGAPRRDRPREEARNINDSPPALRCDGGLCNRFGQTAPPRAPGGAPRAGRRPPRVQNARLGVKRPPRTVRRRSVGTQPAAGPLISRRPGRRRGQKGQAPIRSRSRYWSRARSSARVRGSACARRGSACGRGSAGACDSAWRISPRLGPPGPRRQTRHPSVSWVCWASSAAREGSVKRRPSASVRYPSALRTASWLMPRRALRHMRAAGVSTLEATTARARAAGAPGATVGLAPSTGAAER